MHGYTYIIKRLGSQELGSQKERGGKIHRGRYIRMSKEPEVLSEFPPLSETQANDSDVISLRPLKFSSNTRVVCNWVYHNSKREKAQANGRDEYRVYFPQELDDKQMFEGDLVIFRRSSSAAGWFEYYFLWLTPDDPAFADALQCLQVNSLGGKNYAAYDGRLDFFEAAVERIGRHQPQLDSPSLVDLDEHADECETEAQVIIAPNVLERMIAQPNMRGFENLFRDQASFRQFVLTSYGGTCAVTNECLTYRELSNVEAAHIQPRAHRGPYLPTNGVALRRDIHWAFDKGFFTIGDELEIIVHPEILSLNNYLCRFHGKPLARVTYGPFSPDLYFVRYHREHIYGLFRTQCVITPLD